MVLLAGFDVLLRRYTGQSDLVVGSPVANRNRTEVENLIGLFVNTLALRVRLSRDPSFAELLEQVREVTLAAYDHQNLPFEKLVEELKPERDLSRSPLFQVMLALQNAPLVLELPGLTLSPLEVDPGTARFDLVLNLWQAGSGHAEEGLAGALMYCRDLFDATTTRRFLGHWQSLLEGAVARPSRRLGELVWWRAAELQQLLVESNDVPVRTWPTAAENLHGLFAARAAAARAAAAPAAVAVTFGDHHLSYGELELRADRLASYLRCLGVRPEVPVALCLERRAELPVAILGILKAGGAYVPLDPSYPGERLSFMLEDALSGAEPAVLITRGPLPPGVTVPAHVRVVCLEGERDLIATAAAEPLPGTVSGENPAYVIYTSGSTGRPKGVVVTHRNVVRLMESTRDWYGFSPNDVWTLFHAYAFDFSVWEIWGALAYGGRLVVVPWATSRSPEAFRRLLSDERVTMLNQTPSAFRQLIRADREAAACAPLALDQVIFGGEALELESLRPWLDRHGDESPRLVNMYGITETTVHVTYRPLAAGDLESRSSLIGVPLPELSVHLLDSRLRPVPPGVASEICVGGAGLARGYLQQPALTAERFVPDPMAAAGGERLYRSGDLARRRSDGDLDYLGRIDHQVKIRGFRVEPGEIEAALAGHEAVAECSVILRRDDRASNGDPQLVAYLTPDAERAPSLLRLLRLERRGELAGESLHELANGMVVLCRGAAETDFVYREIFEDRSYLRHGVTLSSATADEPPVVFDVGANIGMFSLLAGVERPGARIYAFEPIPAVFRALRVNARIYGLNARLFDCGLAEEAGTAEFTYYPHDTLISSRFGDAAEEKEVVRRYLANQQRAEGGVELSDEELEALLAERLVSERIACPLKTVSQVIREEGVERIDLLKVDVEKGELGVLAGIEASDWPKIRQVVVEVHDVEGRLARLTRLLESHGLRVSVKQDEALAGTVLYNLYAVRPAARGGAAEGPAPAALAAPRTEYANPRLLTSELRRRLRRHLPDYMVPAALVLLDELPLTPNGKVDRKALPSPERDRLESTADYVEPRGEVEEAVAAAWRQVLGLEQVGADDNFFDVGGHSLALAKVQSRMQETLRAEVSMVDLFRYPTVRTLSAHLGDAAPAVPAAHCDRVAIRRRRLSAGDTEIAVVGLAGRFPGARDPAELWRNLCGGVESISFFGRDELLAAGADPEIVDDPLYVPARAVLDDVDLFDAEFFGFNPQDAATMDPQHRLFLETAWHALEDAGYDPARYGGAVGVFAGVGINTYWLNNLRAEGMGGLSVDVYRSLVGNDGTFLPTMVSYKLGLRGPSVRVQTACSTSLVAVHLAAQALLTGECDMALAGGVSVGVPQATGYVYVEDSILSPDGHCRPFDAAAGGTVGGNGIGVVVLQRLADAVAHGDSIRAVIRGSAINNDGCDKVGFAAPGVSGQAEAITQALGMAGAEPSTVDYVEAHGTGTRLGDPIEIAALTQAFGNGRRKRCALGALKSNVGHLDVAAGVAGLIKVAMMLEHRKLPPSLHFEEPNPEIDFAASPFYVNTRLRDWPRTDGMARRAGVSSFGIGGTNAHVVLEEAPPAPPPAPSRPWQLLTLSAKSGAALEAATDHLATFLGESEEPELADVAHTLQVGRSTFPHRRVLACRGRRAAAAALESRDPKLLLGATPAAEERPVAFLFPGLGDHYPGMAGELYRHEPTFRHELDRCADLLRRPLGVDLRRVLWPPETAAEPKATTDGPDLRRMLRRAGSPTGDQLGSTRISHPAVFAVEYALARLWMEWGVRPAALLGYSVGEYVAACLAGVMTLEDALDLVASRAAMIDELPHGAMVAVALSEPETRQLIGPELSLAAINGPRMCVVAGPIAAIEALEERLRQRELVSSRLATTHAFHSRMLEPISERLVDRASELPLAESRLPWISNVTGTWIRPGETVDPAYWARHMCSPVRFSDGLDALWQKDDFIFLEVGPGQSLGSLARQHPASAGRVLLGSLRHAYDPQDDEALLLATLGRLWLAGVEIDWDGFYTHEKRRRVPLPTYPFERRRFWIERGNGAGDEAVKTAEMPFAQPTAQSDAALHLYLPTWQRTPRPARADPVPEPGSWLVFTGSDDLSHGIVRRLEATGSEVLTAAAGDGFDRRGAGRYTLNPRHPEHYEALVEDLRRAGQVPRRVLHLWSLVDGEVAPDEARDLGFYSLVYLARALADGDPPEVVVVSTRTQRVTGEEAVSPAQATILAPCKVIPQEFPDVACRMIDLPPPNGLANGEKRIGQVLAELAETGSETVVALRGNDRWVESFTPLSLPDNGAAPAVPHGGAWLLAGGLGGRGYEIARWLSAADAPRLALLEPAGFPERGTWPRWLASHTDGEISREIRQLQSLAENGSQMLVLTADPEDAEQLGEAIDRVEAELGPVTGVHITTSDRSSSLFASLTETDRGEWEPRFAAAEARLEALDQALAGRRPELCLLESSIAATLGGVGLAGHAATSLLANAWSENRNHHPGVPWLSLGWGRWQQDEGRTAAASSAADLAPAIAVEEVPRAFLAACELRHESRILLAAGEISPSRRQTRTGPDRPGPAAVARHARPALSNPYVAPDNDLERRLAEMLGELLGIDPVGIHDNFFELGGHSMLGAKLITQLRQIYGVELRLRHLFEAPTVSDLALLTEGLIIADLEQQALVQQAGE